MNRTTGNDAHRRTSAAPSSDATATARPLPQIQFGTGKAEVYLADTINELQRHNRGMSKRAARKCMDMISSNRFYVSRLYKLKVSNVLALKEVVHLLRLAAAEQGARFSKLNADLDEELAAWKEQLTAEGYTAVTLEHRAYKLAMNISKAGMKRLIHMSENQMRQEARRKKAALRSKA